MEAQPHREHLKESAASVPLIERKGAAGLISETDSLALEHDLTELGSSMLQRIRILSRNVYSEVVVDLDTIDDSSHYIVNGQQLKGIVYRAVRRGATQAILDTAHVLQDANQLEVLLHPEDPDKTDE